MADITPIVAVLDMLLTLVASAVLYRKMNEVNDLFNTSKEIMTVGFFSIVALGEYQCASLSHGDVPKVLLCVDDFNPAKFNPVKFRVAA